MNDVISIDTQDLGPEPRAAVVGTDFLTFAVGGGANIEAQADYDADPQRPTGNLPGIARSNFNNKAIRQGTFVAHSLCLWISQQLVQYIPDDGNDIAWIGEWTQALSQFMLALIPPGPNLGAYLPLAGGTMSGNILFQAGVSTVLANNTWYYAKDTVGTNRGLIIKSNDNNVYINDGSSVYVYFNGIPTTNNNVSWSGKDTTGTVRSIIGLLTDNAVHVGSTSFGNIYLDTPAAGSVYLTGNATFANNNFAYWRDTGGTSRAVIGMNTANQLLIGSGVTGTTEIYAGGALNINLHNPTVAMGLLTVSAYTYMNGGGRCYIPGAHDPFQVYSDNGFYARIHYVVGGTRDWTAGCTNAGLFSIADESAHVVRWEIDLSGHVHAYNNLYVSGGASISGGLGCASFSDTGSAQINGGLTVYNSLNVASGNLTVSGGTYAYGSLNVYNGLAVNSGGMGVNGGVTLNNGCTVFNSLYMASGTLTANGQLNCNSNAYIAGSLTIDGLGGLWGEGGNQATWNTNLYLYGQCNTSFILSRGDGWVQGGQFTANHINANNGLCVGGAAINFDYTFGFPIGYHSQWAGGVGCYAAFFTPYCDARYKENSIEVARDALAAILPIRFYQYDLPPRRTPKGEARDARSHVATGVLAQQVMESLPDAVVETEQPVTFHMDHPETGDPLCGWDTQPALGVDLMTLVAYSMRAIQQLAEKVEKLEAAATPRH